MLSKILITSKHASIGLDLQKLLVIIVVSSLPFTYALTIDLSFPLKIYEIALMLLLGLLLYKGKLSLGRNLKLPLQLIFIFWFLSTISFLILRLLNIPSVPIASINYRFGPLINGFTFLLYFIVNILAFVVIGGYAQNYSKLVLAGWHFGAILAALYTWYLFLSSYWKAPVFLLPGINPPQLIDFMGHLVIRSGTFREGNFIGLFFFLSLCLAIYARKHFLAVIYALSLIPTFSTVNIVVTILILSLYFTKHFLVGKSKFRRTQIIFFFISLSFIMILGMTGNDYFLRITGDKLSLDKFSSLTDRLDQILTGLNMALANPFSGVGIGMYSYYYPYYRSTMFLDLFSYNGGIKIPNNIYVKLLSEQGFLALFLFLGFLYSIFGVMKKQKAHSILYYGHFGIVLSFLAYPSYSLMFIWVYWGISLGLSRLESI